MNDVSRFAPDRTLVIRNPVAGRFLSRWRARRLERLLRQQGYDIARTEAPGHATALARDHAARHPEGALVVIGGDGTLLEVLRELPHRVPLALYPVGTVNLLALALGIPVRIREWLRMLQQGAVAEIWGATANDVPFASVVSSGLDAQAVATVNPWLKRLAQEFAYAVSALIGYFRYRNPHWRIRLDGDPVQEPVLGVVMGLVPYFGGPNVNFPDTDPRERSLTVCLLGGTKRCRYWKYTWGMLTGTLAQMQGTVYRKVTSVTIESDPPIAVEADGEFIGNTPVDIRVDEQPRRVLVPESMTRLQQE